VRRRSAEALRFIAITGEPHRFAGEIGAANQHIKGEDNVYNR